MRKPDFFLCYFETTRRCDQGCPNCMTRLPSAAARPELTTSEAKHLVLDELAAICPRGAAAGRLTMGFSLDSVDTGIQERCRAGGQAHLERLILFALLIGNAVRAAATRL